MSEPTAGLTYSAAGVHREAAARAKQRIAELVESTRTADVVSRAGGFGGLFRVPAGFRKPMLVSSADGVGTKLRVAIMAGRHDSVGTDLVNHCVNDILVEGARPLFFLDYIAMGVLDPHIAAELVAGLARGCRDNGCALLGGETAEMPEFYEPGEYDLAGFIVGAVDDDSRPGAHHVTAGQLLVAVASSGFHTNGYSLLRRVLFDRLRLGIDDRYPETSETVADVLLRPHRSYLAAVHPLIGSGAVSALAHITGGGIPENLVRVLPDGIHAHIDLASWRVPVEFRAVQQRGRIKEQEMFLTFNMGVGMILIVPPDRVDGTLRHLADHGEHAWIIGVVLNGTKEVTIR